MAVRAAPTIVLFTAPGTLPGIDVLLQRAGVRVVRVDTVKTRPVEPGLWLPRLLRAPAPDTVVVTSRTAVGAGVRPWRKAAQVPPDLEFWAVGPGTAQALRQAGIRRIHRPRTVGATMVAVSLRTGPHRSILYFRSNAAGPGLARILRAEGHRVLDVIVYRLVPLPPFTLGERRVIARADLLVASSPSALSALRLRLDRSTFPRLVRTTPLVVLGERSERAAHGHKFRHVSVAPSATAQRFTRHLLRELRDVTK